MAKSKAKELLNGSGPKERTLSSGVTVIILPFPAGLWQDLNIKSLRDFPDPVPPKKKIKTVDGEEEIDDLNNPDYLTEKALAESQRHNLFGEAIIDLCVQVDLEKWESKIKRLEKYSDPFPEDPEDRRIEFLTRFALRGRNDYEIVMTEAITEMMASNPEVAERLEFFRREVERTTASQDAASGAS